MGLSNSEAEKRAETWIKMCGPSAFREPIDRAVWIAIKDMTLEQFVKYKEVSEDGEHPWVQEYHSRVSQVYSIETKKAQAAASASQKPRVVIKFVGAAYYILMTCFLLATLVWLL